MANTKKKSGSTAKRKSTSKKSSSSKKTSTKSRAKTTAKKNTTSRSAANHSTASKTSTRARATNTNNNNPQKENRIHMGSEAQLVLSFGIMLLLLLSNFGLCGSVGKVLSQFLFGIFGCVQYVMPVAFFFAIAILIGNKYSTLAMEKITAGFITLMMISAFVQLIYQGDHVSVTDLFAVACKDHMTGGIIGGSIGLVLKKGFGTAGAMIIIFCIAFLSLIMLTQRSFVEFFQNVMLDLSELLGKNNKKEAEVEREPKDKNKKEETPDGEQMELIFEDTHKTNPSKKKKWGSFIKMKSGQKKEPVITPEPKPVDHVEKKVQSLEEEKKTKKPRTHSNQKTGASRKGGMVDVPVFTSSDSVKVKDQTQELHVKPFPFTFEDGRTEDFEGELDFTAFSFNSGKTPEEFAEEIRANALAFEAQRKNKDAFEPPYKAKGSFQVSELKSTEEDSEESMEEQMIISLPQREKTGSAKNAGMKMLKLSPDELVHEPEWRHSLQNEDVVDTDDIVDIDSDDLAMSDQNLSGQQGDVSISFEEDWESSLDDEAIDVSMDEYQAVNHRNNKNLKTESDKQNQTVPNKKNSSSKYKLPSPLLLDGAGMATKSTVTMQNKETEKKLHDTLASFGVNVTMTGISCGPSVTRYEMVPEPGTKVSKIVSLTDDIKLNLAAADIRIEAPIPGKSAIGIEVPNEISQVVHFGELISSKAFKNSRSKLTFAVGKDIGGNIVVSDIAKMPHLLIAGATGSGKSVCINTLIMSILYKASPDEVKLIMVDPKKVELNEYNGIPHLLIPVVTDPKKASAALNWACHEMMERYDKFTEYGVRNIEGYNAKVDQLQATGELDNEKLQRKRLPQIVIIIDELADLMMVAQNEVEDAIVRLSQLARAAGIHLVIATQRPSVNVITGLIKANVPSRIAFSVTSGIDSRTILDSNGAEKLLGKGDMLFFPQGMQKPVRIQGALISDKEVSEVVNYIKSQKEADPKEIENNSEQIEKKMQMVEVSKDRDEHFEAAARFVVEKDKATIGMLQRMFKVGFNRAARIMDQLAEEGIVGPEEGTKPRKVLMSEEQLQQYFEDYL